MFMLDAYAQQIIHQIDRLLLLLLVHFIDSSILKKKLYLTLARI